MQCPQCKGTGEVPTPDALGERIRLLRRERGWNQVQFGERAGISFGYVSSVEQGKNKPSLAVLARIAEALGVSASRLLEGAL